MTRAAIALLTLAMCLGLSACHKELTLDATNAKTLKESSEKIRASLAGKDLKNYDHAVTVIVASTLDPIEVLDVAQQGEMPTQVSVFAKIKPAFDGLTAKEVVAKESDALALVNLKLTKWQNERVAMQARRKAFEGASAILAKLHVTNVNLRTATAALPGFGDNQVMLDVTLKNDLDAPVTQSKFLVQLMPPGINNPWVSQAVTRTFETPIAAGASATIEVGPIAVSIPDTYKGPVTLETALQFQRADLQGQPPIVLPTWSQYDEIEGAKLETAITETRQLITTGTPVLPTHWSQP